METPQPHEVQIFDDDTSSIASFEDIPPRHRPRTRNLSRRIISPPPKREILKVDGKVPDVIHVVKYLGWRDNVVECKSFYSTIYI
jgi:hypothetical protein